MAESGPGEMAAALAGLPGCGTVGLTRLLADRSPSEAWAAIVHDDLTAEFGGANARLWREHAARVDLEQLALHLVESGVRVTTPHDDDHPVALIHDVDPAPVIFRRGAAISSSVPAVAIVGTRRCTPTGREIAEALGHALAEAGVSVVSGLALGIDGAAHTGALDAGGAPPVGVVGSGLDVVYPRRNSGLWRRVGEQGTLLCEAPLGARPEAWRFPARNRFIAALADVVVVVESKAGGGSMITVEQAVRRGRPVLAVPGSVRNPAAAGTNQLISEGCQPVCSVDDVLVALDIAAAGPGPQLLTEQGEPVPAGSEPAGPGVELEPPEVAVLQVVDYGGLTIDALALECALPVAAVAAAVVALEQMGLVSLVDGRVRRRVRPATAGRVDPGSGPDPVPCTR